MFQTFNLMILYFNTQGQAKGGGESVFNSSMKIYWDIPRPAVMERAVCCSLSGRVSSGCSVVAGRERERAAQ